MDPEPDPSAFATPTSPTAWRKTFSYVSPHVNYSQLGGGGDGGGSGGGGISSSSIMGTPSNGALSTQPRADAHTLRLLEESRVAAVDHWSRRTVVACCLQIVAAVCEFFSKYWYSNFASFLAGFVGAWGALRLKNEFLFVNAILASLSILKDCGLVFLVLSAHQGLDAHSIFIIVVSLVDCALVQPYSLYCLYYLYTSINVSLTYKR